MPHSEMREPRLASIASWAGIAASFGLSASTWIALAELAGFNGSWTIGSVTVKLAWLMPVSVDVYLVVALVLWMSPVPAHIASFARKNTYGSAAVGILAQSAFHSLLIWSTTHVLWRTVMAACVGALPPLFAGLAVHMRALIRREGRNQVAPEAPAPKPEATTIRVPAARPTPTMPAPPAPAVEWRRLSEPEVEDAELAALAQPETVPPVPVFQEPEAAPGFAGIRKYPTSAYPMVPAPATPPAEPAAPGPPAPAPRRTAAETRRLIEQIWAAEPHLTQLEVAEKAGITDRWLRELTKDTLVA